MQLPNRQIISYHAQIPVQYGNKLYKVKADMGDYATDDEILTAMASKLNVCTAGEVVRELIDNRGSELEGTEVDGARCSRVGVESVRVKDHPFDSIVAGDAVLVK
jgi:hypothetical protein